MDWKGALVALGGPEAQRVAEYKQERRAMDALGSYLGKDAAPEAQALYAADPRLGFEAEGMVMERQQAQQKAVADQQEAQKKELVNGALLLTRAPPQQQAAIYTALRSRWAQQYPEMAAELPEQYDESVAGYASQILAMNSGALPADAFKANAAPRRPTSVEEFEFAQQNPEYAAFLEAKRRAGGTNVTVQNPGLALSYDEEGRPVVNFGGGMTKPNVTKTEASIVAAQNQLRSLRTVGEQVADKYLTYQGRVEGALGGVQDKLGMDSEMANYNAERGAALQGVEQFFNQYRKEITGAAAAAQELDALKKAVINSDLGPREFKARYNALIAQIEGGLRADVQRLGGSVQDAPNTPMPNQRVQSNGAPSAADLSDDALLEALNR
jgi:hypothetical protein